MKEGEGTFFNVIFEWFGRKTLTALGRQTSIKDRGFSKEKYCSLFCFSTPHSEKSARADD